MEVQRGAGEKLDQMAKNPSAFFFLLQYFGANEHAASPEYNLLQGSLLLSNCTREAKSSRKKAPHKQVPLQHLLSQPDRNSSLRCTHAYQTPPEFHQNDAQSAEIFCWRLNRLIPSYQGRSWSLMHRMVHLPLNDFPLATRSTEKRPLRLSLESQPQIEIWSILDKLTNPFFSSSQKGIHLSLLTHSFHSCIWVRRVKAACTLLFVFPFSANPSFESRIAHLGLLTFLSEFCKIEPGCLIYAFFEPLYPV